MKTGLEISSEMQQLQEMLEDNELDFDSPQIQEMICAWAEALEEERVSKADNICALICEWVARASFRKEEAERLQHRAVVDERNAKRLKEYLHFLLRTWRIKKLETPRYSLSIAANGGKLPLQIESEVANTPERLPERFQVQRVEINREAIRAALEAGEAVPGCKLAERGESLRIR